MVTGLSSRWIPRELVQDLHAEGLALGLQRLTLVNALEAVAAQLLQIK